MKKVDEKKKYKYLDVSEDKNEWNYSYPLDSVYTYDATSEYNYEYELSGPVCKVVWFRNGKEYEKFYSSREQAIEKQKSLLLKEIPAVIKSC